ncbi:MAG TPA: hypothetical protein VFU10_10370 [Gaiellaceae bacterium]|nr:hypothetical protein [Gaiellaceae bacterium]
MAKRRPMMTAEERAELDAQHDANKRMAQERIAYHTAKAREQEERRARRERRWAPLRRLFAR